MAAPLRLQCMLASASVSNTDLVLWPRELIQYSFYSCEIASGLLLVPPHYSDGTQAQGCRELGWRPPSQRGAAGGLILFQAADSAGFRYRSLFWPGCFPAEEEPGPHRLLSDPFEFPLSTHYCPQLSVLKSQEQQENRCVSPDNRLWTGCDSDWVVFFGIFLLFVTVRWTLQAPV